ncbi:hypothetical protein GCM10009827_097560 [Dactylosporangium maewongense]|uniref:WD40 repeat protein n=1 Tax=Dactylosporangium maewongense TaxID=634393 RepID=A0ABP4NEW2_9ACTN
MTETGAERTRGSALADVDGLIEGLRDPASTVTAGDVYQRLVDEHLWWRACQEAVELAPDRLADWADGTERELFAALGGYGGPEVARAARILAGIAACCGAPEDTAPDGYRRLEQAIAYWSAPPVLPDLDTAPGLAAAARSGPVRALLRRIDAMAGGPPRTWVAVQAAMLAGALTAAQDSQRINVVYDATSADVDGVAGTLELTIVPDGPAGLYPDPRQMVFFRAGDDEFSAALTAAWRHVFGSDTRPPCVLWSTTHEGRPQRLIAGASLGAAFGVGLLELRDRRLRRRWLRAATLRMARQQAAVTGVIGEDGRLQKVGGLHAKLAASGRNQWRLIAPTDSEAEAPRPLPPGAAPVWVPTVGKARSRLRKLRKAPLVVVGVVVAALIGGGVYNAVNQNQLAAAAHDVGDAQRDRLAQELLGRAVDNRREQPALAVRLGLAAVTVHDTPATRAGLVSTLAGDQASVVLADTVDPVTAVALGPAGLAVTASLKSVTLWDISDLGDPVRTNQLPTGEPVTAVALRADGQRLLVGGASGTTILFDVADPARPLPVATWSPPPPGTGVNRTIVSLAFLGDSTRVMTTQADGQVLFWDVTTSVARLTQRLQVPSGRLNAAVTTPDGRMVLAGSTTGLYRWNVGAAATDQPVQVADDDVRTLALSADAKRVVVGATKRVTAIIQLTELSQQLYGSLPNLLRSGDAAVAAVATTDDMISAATDSTGTVSLVGGTGGDSIVWQATSGSTDQVRQVLREHTGPVVSVAVAADGQTALTGGADGAAIVWSIAPRATYHLRGSLFGMTGPTRTIAASGAGQVVAATDAAAVLWDVLDPASPRRVTAFPDSVRHVGSVALSSDGRLALTVGDSGGPRFWDLNGREPEPLPVPNDLPAKFVGLRGDGQLAVAAGGAGDLTLWRTGPGTGPEVIDRWLSGVTEPIMLAFSLDGTTVAVGGAGGDTAVWKVDESGQRRRVAGMRPVSGPVTALALSADGRLLVRAGDTDAAATLWDLTDPAHPIARGAMRGHGTAVRVAGINHAKTLALTGNGDGSVTLWTILDPQQPRKVAELRGNRGPINVATFGPSQQVVLTGSTSGAPLVWDITAVDAIAADPVGLACAGDRRALDVEEWERFVGPDVPYTDGCAR